MNLVYKVSLVLITVTLLTACATKAKKEEEKVKVICPACGTDFDALFHMNF